jgi:hypothetical protein
MNTNIGYVDDTKLTIQVQIGITFISFSCHSLTINHHIRVNLTKPLCYVEGGTCPAGMLRRRVRAHASPLGRGRRVGLS